MMSEENKRLADAGRRAIPTRPPDPIEWAEENVKMPGSARSQSFNASITPWIVDTIRNGCDSTTRTNTLVKPVQTGGSAAGEVLLCYWIRYGHGFVQYNWSNDKRAVERWNSRIWGILEACPPVAEKLAHLEAGKLSKGEIQFGNVFFRQQGVFMSSNLDSDTVTNQLNEEVHDWEPGHLKKARNRFTAVWDYKSFDISNAGKVGDQLHQAFLDGTQQWWEVKCPSCGLYHVMRSRWEDRKPELGGLRYDSEKCKRDGGRYDYNMLRSTLRYQMPCGFTVHDDPSERRALSLSGRYGAPRNDGAELSQRSYTYDAVTVDFLDWVQLVKDKHDALRARRLGNIAPWHRYITERECLFYDPNDVPIGGTITLTRSLKKNREGLSQLAGVKRYLRPFALDYQEGHVSLGEFPFWWLVIRDFAIVEEAGKLKLISQLVFEGKIETDDQVIATLDAHECKRWRGCADSGHDAKHVYKFCLKNGINAIKGGGEDWYGHEGGTKRIFSTEKPLHAMLNAPSIYPYVKLMNGKQPIVMPDPREPLFWLYSKHGIRESLAWLRASTDYRTPDDVSDDYQKHNEAEDRLSKTNAMTGEKTSVWVQHGSCNDLFVCECYISMEVDQAGMMI